MKIYNVMKRKKEEFVPVVPNKVKIYACGITVSGEAHIGHAFQAIVFDVIKKYFEYKKFKVTYVRNYTDVDDKIIARAKELNVNPMDYAASMITRTDSELEMLGNDRATVQAKATDNIAEMIIFISKLIEKGYAYTNEFGDVYFSVDKFKGYGKLSNRTGEDSISGTRKETEPGKKDEKDFALWKSAKPGEISWKSPWGEGRPGWHIECSTMSMKYLGETIDIHGGGKDLLFPHHENEIAQSEALTGKTFSNYWMHNGLIKINGQKMSKSLGNGISIKQMLESYEPDVIRFGLLQNNYKTDLNVVDGMFEEIEKHMYKFYSILGKANKIQVDVENLNSEYIQEMQKNFELAMDNDFNTALAISQLFEYFEKINSMIEKNNNILEAKQISSKIIELYYVLGLFQKDPDEFISKIQNKYLEKMKLTSKEIEELIQKRQDSKENKDYEAADSIRKDLLNKGIILKDTKQGTEWEVEIK